MNGAFIWRHFIRGVDLVSSAFPFLAPKNESGIRLSPFLHWLIHIRQMVKVPDWQEMKAQDARAMWRKDILPLRAQYPVLEVRELSIPTNTGPLEARWYLPFKENQIEGLLVYLHGGGYVFGDLETNDDVARLLTQKSGMQVLSVAYRQAPEFPFPTAVEDAEAAVRWAQAQADLFGTRKEFISVGGDSAGGNLAAVTAQTLTVTGQKPFAQILIYPMTDRVTVRPSHQLYDKKFFLDFAEREWFYQQYLLNDEKEGLDIRVSPLLAEGARNLPRALVVTSGFDILKDEGKAYAEFLRTSGAEVEHISLENMTHGFLNLAGAHRDSEKAIITIAKAWRAVCLKGLKQ